MKAVEHMALAMYFAELASTPRPRGQEAAAQLRLLLNSLYLLSEGRAPRLVKAVYELRAMTLAGFYAGPGGLRGLCEIRGRRVLLRCTEGPPVLRRMRREARAGMQFGPGGAGGMRAHRVQRDDKLFSFSLAEHSTQLLGAVTGRWALYCVDKPLRSLDFLNTVLD